MLRYHWDERPEKKYRSIDDVGDADTAVTAQQFKDLLLAVRKLTWGKSMATFEYGSRDRTNTKERFLEFSVKCLDLAMGIAKREKIDKPQHFWMAIHPWLVSGFEVVLNDKENHRPFGGREPKYMGILLGRLKVYECDMVDNGAVLIGYGETLNPPEHYRTIRMNGYS